jgi:hypothetical protein
MLTVTAGATFVFDEAKARAWLDRGIQQYNEGRYDDADDFRQLPDVQADWRADYQEPGDIAALVHKAVHAGVIELPVRAYGDGIGMIFEHDRAGTLAYRYIAEVASSVRLSLVSYAKAFVNIGEPCTVGADAALAVLAEAVEAVNNLLADLDQHIAAVAA